MLIRTLALFILLALSALPAFGAPKTRPFSGEGLLIIRPFTPERAPDIRALAIYAEPGVERVTELHSGKIPSLAQVIEGRSGEFTLAVMGKKGNWLRVSYDEAGHEGWLEMLRYWEYSPWRVFLKGRRVRLLPGLKKEFYLLRREPSPASPQLNTLSQQKNLRIVEVRDEWALVLFDSTTRGWLRWKDNDGRFTISIDNPTEPQND